MNPTFPLVRPGNGPLWVIVPTLVALTAALAVVSASKPSPAWYALLAGVVILAGTVPLIAIAVLFKRGSVTVSSAGLRVSVPLYGRLVPAAALRGHTARVIDLSTDWRLALDWRTNGIGFPGYNVGWFRLGNGDKAFAAVTDAHRVVFITTDQGFSVLLSVADPQALIASLAAFACPCRGAAT